MFNQRESEHEILRTYLNKEENRTQIISADIKSKSELISFKNNKINHDKIQIKFFKTFLKKATKNYYIVMNHYHDGTKFTMVDKDFDCILTFIWVGNGTESVSNYLLDNYKYIIEVEKIHSYSKDKGKTIVENLKKIANVVNVPIALYDDNNKDIHYYNKLGFKNSIRKGFNDEIYKVYFPSKYINFSKNRISDNELFEETYNKSEE